MQCIYADWCSAYTPTDAVHIRRLMQCLYADWCSAYAPTVAVLIRRLIQSLYAAWYSAYTPTDTVLIRRLMQIHIYTDLFFPIHINHPHRHELSTIANYYNSLQVILWYSQLVYLCPSTSSTATFYHILHTKSRNVVLDLIEHIVEAKFGQASAGEIRYITYIHVMETINSSLQKCDLVFMKWIIKWIFVYSDMCIKEALYTFNTLCINTSYLL